MLDPTVKMPFLEKIDLEKNWSKFTELLISTNREGVPHFLAKLNETDFKLAPASHKHHLAIPGGLCQHSLNTWKYAYQLDKMIGLNLQKESLLICGLLHDLCKINYYTIGEEFDKEYKNQTDRWRKKEVYQIDDKFPMGHGEKSVAIALDFGITLSVEEMLAIRWHMAFSDFGVHGVYPSGAPFRQAFQNPLVKIIAMADQLAVIHEDHVFV